VAAIIIIIIIIIVIIAIYLHENGTDYLHDITHYGIV